MTPEDRPIDGRHLLRHAESGGKVTALGEGSTVADSRYHASNGPMPGTVINWWQLLAAMRQKIYLFGDVFDTLIKTAPIAAEVFHDPHTKHVLPRASKPPNESRWGQEHGRSIPF